ncbi:hypothetical protein AvCA_18210 [Azotobacter vinelandii CA]|nr:hypothetical protein AvCA_18210 [Azotobacter vinelandii CA]
MQNGVPMSRLLPVTLLLLGGAAQAAPEPVPLYREIKDWVVACDNLRSCQAISAAAFGFSPLRLVIGRDAGPRAQPWVRLTYSGQPGHFTLSTDDRPLPDALASLLRTGAGEGEPILHGEGDMARAAGRVARWRDPAPGRGGRGGRAFPRRPFRGAAVDGFGAGAPGHPRRTVPTGRARRSRGAGSAAAAPAAAFPRCHAADRRRASGHPPGGDGGHAQRMAGGRPGEPGARSRGPCPQRPGGAGADPDVLCGL